MRSHIRLDRCQAARGLSLTVSVCKVRSITMAKLSRMLRDALACDQTRLRGGYRHRREWWPGGKSRWWRLEAGENVLTGPGPWPRRWSRCGGRPRRF